MTKNWDGIYCAYMTGQEGQGFGMFVFHQGVIAGADPLGVTFDGSFKIQDNGDLVGSIAVHVPANGEVIQGVSTGSGGLTYEVPLMLAAERTESDFIRFETLLGPVNVRLEKIRGIGGEDV